MLFEFDSQKNESNIDKHKVSFEEAALIWSDPDLLVVPARHREEKRRMAIGRTYSVLFSVIHTKRGEMIRIISARRSTRKEAQLYEQRKGKR